MSLIPLRHGETDLSPAGCYTRTADVALSACSAGGFELAVSVDLVGPAAEARARGAEGVVAYPVRWLNRLDPA